MKSQIIVNPGVATTFVGGDATTLFRYRALISALELWAKGIKVNPNTLKAAKQITKLRTNKPALHIAKIEAMCDDLKKNIEVLGPKP